MSHAMEHLSPRFIGLAQSQPRTFPMNGSGSVTFRRTSVTDFGSRHPVLEIVSDDSGAVMGYITPYSADQYGAIASHMAGNTPTVVTTVEEAVQAVLE